MIHIFYQIIKKKEPLVQSKVTCTSPTPLLPTSVETGILFRRAQRFRLQGDSTEGWGSQKWVWLSCVGPGAVGPAAGGWVTSSLASDLNRQPWEGQSRGGQRLWSPPPSAGKAPESRDRISFLNPTISWTRQCLVSTCRMEGCSDGQRKDSIKEFSLFSPQSHLYHKEGRLCDPLKLPQPSRARHALPLPAPDPVQPPELDSGAGGLGDRLTEKS